MEPVWGLGGGYGTSMGTGRGIWDQYGDWEGDMGPVWHWEGDWDQYGGWERDMGPVWGLGGGYGTSMALGLGTGSSKSIGMEAGSRWPPSPTCAWGCCGAAAAPGRGRCCSLCPPGRAGGRGAASPSTPGTPSPGPRGWTGSSAAGGGDMKGGVPQIWGGGLGAPGPQKAEIWG